MVMLYGFGVWERSALGWMEVNDTHDLRIWIGRQDTN